jgi:NAD(P)-dependent dehydrogenase (short-subunit alcohol dehydrogenase family)
VKADAGRIDVLFANAGGGSMQPLGATTEEQYEDIFGRNVLEADRPRPRHDAGSEPGKASSKSAVRKSLTP